MEHLILTRSKWHVNARLGYGYFKAGGTIDQDIVAGVNVYYGNKKSHPEIGLYLTYANHNYVEKHIAKAIYFAPNLSYRFQKPTRGLFIRVSYVPVFKVKDYTGPNLWVRLGDFHQTFGLAVGYYFGRERKTE